MNFIETESGCFQGESYEDLLASVEFSLGELSEKEKQGLKAFYDRKQANNEPISHGQKKMGVDLVECGSHLMFQVESIYFSITN